MLDTDGKTSKISITQVVKSVRRGNENDTKSDKMKRKVSIIVSSYPEVRILLLIHKILFTQ